MKFACCCCGCAFGALPYVAPLELPPAPLPDDDGEAHGSLDVAGAGVALSDAEAVGVGTLIGAAALAVGDALDDGSASPEAVGDADALGDSEGDALLVNEHNALLIGSVDGEEDGDGELMPGGNDGLLVGSPGAAGPPPPNAAAATEANAPVVTTVRAILALFIAKLVIPGC